MTCSEFRNVWGQQEDKKRDSAATTVLSHLQTCEECSRWVKDEARSDVYFLDWIRQFLPEEALPHVKIPKGLS